MSDNKMIYVDNTDLGDGHSSYELSDASGDKIHMRYSMMDGGWSPQVRGEVAAALTDTGDGVIIKFWNSKTKIKLDYSQVLEMQLLLKFLNEDSNLQSRYTHIITKFKQV